MIQLIGFIALFMAFGLFAAMSSWSRPYQSGRSLERVRQFSTFNKKDNDEHKDDDEDEPDSEAAQ